MSTSNFMRDADWERSINKWKSLAEKAEALNRQWNIEASKFFAGSEYVDDPKRVFARVQQLWNSHGEAMKARVKAEAEKVQLQVRVEELEQDLDYRKNRHVGLENKAADQKQRIAALEEQLKQAGEVLKALHDDVAEYQRINNLGGYDNHAMKQARAAIEAVNKEGK